MQLMIIQSSKSERVRASFLVVFCISILSLFSSCGTSLETVGLSELRKDIEMRKGPCYGRCPVYTLRIYENGIVTYTGERYTDRLGVYIKKLSQEEYFAILDSFQRINLWQYDDVYKGEIPDAQTVSITYFEEGDIKSITGKDGRPLEIQDLESLLSTIADNRRDWVLKQKPPSKLPDYVIQEEIIVQLPEAEEFNVNKWVRKYRKHRMVLKKQIRPESPYYLVTYDKDTITPKELLDKIRRDASVRSAEFNKKAKWRS